MSISAAVVADHFMLRAKEEARGLTALQRIKLVYLAHGWHLGIHGTPLIWDTIEAWKYGPIIPSIFHRCLLREVGSYVRLTPEHDRHLTDVWRAYRVYSGIELSTFCHKDDSPWYDVWTSEGGTKKSGGIITNEMLKKYYAGKLEKRVLA